MVMPILKLALALSGLGAALASQWPVFDEPFKPARALNAMSAPRTRTSRILFIRTMTGERVGPCRVTNSTKGPEFFEHSWNSNANVIYLDQPIYSGFSYAEYGETIYTTEEAAEDVAKAVVLFFESFSQYKGRSFHMAGISYGGRYIPLFASAVHDQNALLLAQGLIPVNLTSITIGNGNTDMSALWQGAYELVCTSTTVTPVLPIRECIHMKHEVQQCRQQMKEHCEDRFDLKPCRDAFNRCDTAIMDPYRKTGLNIYDISRPCEGGSENLCYPVTAEITAYLSRPDVRALLGVDAQVPEEYALCNMSVGNMVWAFMLPATLYDLALSLEWSGKKAFNDAPLREWWAVGEKAGVTRSANGLTFATIDRAGHLAAHDKPEQVLAMLNRWLAAVNL
ncbi:alpha/beta-hydrolase [Peniophora sp. CONT]|nr:alpha/beta-hydrolase [Peniophora sp. CONT]